MFNGYWFNRGGGNTPSTSKQNRHYQSALDGGNIKNKLVIFGIEYAPYKAPPPDHAPVIFGITYKPYKAPPPANHAPVIFGTAYREE